MLHFLFLLKCCNALAFFKIFSQTTSINGFVAQFGGFRSRPQYFWFFYVSDSNDPIALSNAVSGEGAVCHKTFPVISVPQTTQIVQCNLQYDSHYFVHVAVGTDHDARFVNAEGSKTFYIPKGHGAPMVTTTGSAVLSMQDEHLFCKINLENSAPDGNLYWIVADPVAVSALDVASGVTAVRAGCSGRISQSIAMSDGIWLDSCKVTGKPLLMSIALDRDGFLKNVAMLAQIPVLLNHNATSIYTTPAIQASVLIISATSKGIEWAYRLSDNLQRTGELYWSITQQRSPMIPLKVKNSREICSGMEDDVTSVELLSSSCDLRVGGLYSLWIATDNDGRGENLQIVDEILFKAAPHTTPEPTKYPTHISLPLGGDLKLLYVYQNRLIFRILLGGSLDPNGVVYYALCDALTAMSPQDISRGHNTIGCVGHTTQIKETNVFCNAPLNETGTDQFAIWIATANSILHQHTFTIPEQRQPPPCNLMKTEQDCVQAWVCQWEISRCVFSGGDTGEEYSDNDEETNGREGRLFWILGQLSLVFIGCLIAGFVTKVCQNTKPEAKRFPRALNGKHTRTSSYLHSTLLGGTDIPDEPVELLVDNMVYDVPDCVDQDLNSFCMDGSNYDADFESVSGTTVSEIDSNRVPPIFHFPY